MTTNATVEARHKDMAATAVGYQDWREVKAFCEENSLLRNAFLAHAQTLANLEAARAENADLTNRLAEIGRIAVENGWHLNPIGQRFRQVAALASGHTPSPCPHCAAKDEAMEAFRREVSEAVSLHDQMWADKSATRIRFLAAFSRFIIPPADPVAEALNSAIDVFRDELSKGSRPSDARTAALAELKSRLPAIEAKESQP